MGLITLLVAIAFTALYFSRAIDKKPPQLAFVTDLMMVHIDKIAKWGTIYGLVALALTLLIGYSPSDMLIRLINNGLICLMALPFIFEKIVEKYQGKVNAAIMEEAKNIVGWISSHEKNMSYFGAVSVAVLFLTLFK
jgi:hypothetical protein